ncbi:MAG: M1 family metallopeptidase [Anaerolineales bacterium]|jgi:aminopeptidase N
MRCLRKLALLLVFVLSACVQRSAVELDATPTEPLTIDFDVSWVESPLQGRAWLKGSYDAATDLSKATEYFMDIVIPDDFEMVSGQLQILYTNNETQPLQEIYLRLFPNLAGGEASVESLTVDGQPVKPVYEAQDSAVRIDLPQMLAPGESLSLELEFSTSIPRQMEGNYGLFGYFEGFLVLDTFYPMIPAYDDDGWQRDATPPNGDPTYNDASFYFVRVSAPLELSLFASGIEVAREEHAGEQKVTFASGPARDFYVAAAENLEMLEEQVGETSVKSYAPERFRDHSELALRTAVNALVSYERRFGEYPYPEMELISTPMQALGIEYPGIMGINIDLYDPNETFGGGIPSRSYIEATIAHEVSHQWFYNIVGNDQVNQPWLDEALAQYSTYLYFLDTYGEAAASSFEQSWYDRWDRTDRIEKPIGLPAGDYQGAEYSGIVYGRGPIFMAELAKVMGSESMDAFLRDYVLQNAWGITTPQIFQNAAEQACSCELDDLFLEWVGAEN